MCSRVALCAINGRIKRNRRNRKCATVPEIRSIYRDGAAGATRRREGEFHRESRRSFMDDDCRGIRLKFRTIRRRDARRSYGNPDSPRDQRGATAKSHRGSSLYIRHSFFLSPLFATNGRPCASSCSLFFAKQHFVIVLGCMSTMYPSSVEY